MQAADTLPTGNVGDRILQSMVECGASDREIAALFSPEGLARQVTWECEDGWLVGYTTSSIHSSFTGANDGKFAYFAYKPSGPGARSGNATTFVRTVQKYTAKRKTARARAEALYYRHSPKAKARHGR